MAMYYCNHCEELCDNDWLPMDENERCPPCANECEEARREDLDDDFRKGIET